MLCAKEGGDALLFDVWVVFLVCVREMESHDGEAGVVIGAGLVLFAELDVGRVLECMDTLGSVYVAYTFVPLQGMMLATLRTVMSHDWRI